MNRKTLFLLGKRLLSTVKRKYPIDPKEADKLPIFDYGKSKKEYNRIYVFGHKKTGALGIPVLKENEKNLRESQYKPKRLTFAEKHVVTHVACGFGFTVLGIDTEDARKIYGTGINTDSQIGYHAIRKGKPLGILFVPLPIDLPINEDTKIIKLAAGRAHTLVLTDCGLFSLGNNAYGQCGRIPVEEEDYSASNYIHHIRNVEGKKIVDVVAGQDHSVLLTEDGCVYSCGWGADGQTGLGHYDNTPLFSKVKGDIDGENIVKVACRSDFVMAINDKGDVFGWGNTEYGQLTSLVQTQQQANPTHISMTKTLGKIKDVAAGGSFCMVLNENHEVFVWGYGLLGTGPKVQQSDTPIQIPSTLFGQNYFQPDNVVTKINCGISHMTAVTNHGDLFTWGRDRKGCLGLGEDKDKYFPLKVALGGKAINVSCGIDHSVVLCKPYI